MARKAPPAALPGVLLRIKMQKTGAKLFDNAEILARFSALLTELEVGTEERQPP
jgi:hypothetical protein